MDFFHCRFQKVSTKTLEQCTSYHVVCAYDVFTQNMLQHILSERSLSESST